MTAKPPTVPFIPPEWPSFVDRPFGVPLDPEYDGQRDMAESIKVGLAAIRERKAEGGQGWNPGAKAHSAPPVRPEGNGRPDLAAPLRITRQRRS